MKKYFILMFMALVGINYTYAATLNEDEGEDVFIEIYKKKFNTDEFARSVAMFVVEATYYASTDEVVVDLHEIGTATVEVKARNKAGYTNINEWRGSYYGSTTVTFDICPDAPKNAIAYIENA